MEGGGRERKRKLHKENKQGKCDKIESLVCLFSFPFKAIDKRTNTCVPSLSFLSYPYLEETLLALPLRRHQVNTVYTAAFHAVSGKVI